MANRISFPDAKDRTTADPKVLLNSGMVMALFNHNHPLNGLSRITPIVKMWMRAQAEARAWIEVEFIGDQCLLTSDQIK